MTRHIFHIVIDDVTDTAELERGDRAMVCFEGPVVDVSKREHADGTIELVKTLEADRTLSVRPTKRKRSNDD